MDASIFQPRGIYTFEVYPSVILGNDFKNVTVQGVLDAESANAVTNIYTRHSQIYPYLPAGTINDPESYTYLKIRTEAGVVMAIAVEWIVPATVTSKTEAPLTVYFQAFPPNKIPFLRQLLASNDLPAFEIKN